MNTTNFSQLSNCWYSPAKCLPLGSLIAGGHIDEEVGHLLAGLLHDGDEVARPPPVLAADERHGTAGFARPARPAHAVNVLVDVAREVEVDDVGDVLMRGWKRVRFSYCSHKWSAFWSTVHIHLVITN